MLATRVAALVEAARRADVDPLPCGFSVSYFVVEAQRYVAVVRVRRTAATSGVNAGALDQLVPIPALQALSGSYACSIVD